MTIYLAIAALAAYVLSRWLGGLTRARRELGLTRVRVADLAGSVGCRVRFAHPTRRRDRVEGRLVGARESLLSLAWYRLVIEHDDGSRAAYEVTGRRWAEVANATRRDAPGEC